MWTLIYDDGESFFFTWRGSWEELQSRMDTLVCGFDYLPDCFTLTRD